MTRAELLSKKLGKKVVCDFCNKEKTFTSDWMMNRDGVGCPECMKNRSGVSIL